MNDPRGAVDMVGHTILLANTLDPDSLPPISNIIVRAKSNEGRWVEESTLAIGEWRAHFSSVYIQWSLALNGVHVAAEKYTDPVWSSTKQFSVKALRVEGARHALQEIAVWKGPCAAKNHLGTAPKLCAWGVVEMFACFEVFIFELYRIFLNHHPDSLIKGQEPEHKTLRRLQREAEADPSKRTAWNEAWAKRLSLWHKNKIYKGLHNTFLAYYSATGLHKPKSYTQTDVSDWAEMLEAVGILRNCLVHGAKDVPMDLAEISKKPHASTFDFKEGQSFSVELKHLQGIELFANQLLTAINLSLVEHPSAGK